MRAIARFLTGRKNALQDKMQWAAQKSLAGPASAGGPLLRIIPQPRDGPQRPDCVAGQRGLTPAPLLRQAPNVSSFHSRRQLFATTGTATILLANRRRYPHPRRQIQRGWGKFARPFKG
jgi:hypothetical protein